MAEESGTKRRKTGDGSGTTQKALDWATEFDSLEEDDQYTYLEMLAPKLSKMHLQFLQGIIGFDDDEDEGEDDFGEEEEEDDEDGEEEGEEEDAEDE